MQHTCSIRYCPFVATQLTLIFFSLCLSLPLSPSRDTLFVTNCDWFFNWFFPPPFPSKTPLPPLLTAASCSLLLLLLLLLLLPVLALCWCSCFTWFCFSCLFLSRCPWSLAMLCCCCGPLVSVVQCPPLPPFRPAHVVVIVQLRQLFPPPPPGFSLLFLRWGILLQLLALLVSFLGGFVCGFAPPPITCPVPSHQRIFLPPIGCVYRSPKKSL